MKTKRKHVWWKWLLGGIAVLLVIVLAGAWLLFGSNIKAANSITRLEEGLYAMEYTGDYGFDAFLEQGGAVSASALADYLVEFLSHGFYKNSGTINAGEFGCSTICVEDGSGGTLFGRNYDWAACQAMIVHTRPEKGYASISTCCLDFLGFGTEFRPDGSMVERMESLAAIYVPLDGMNEKGLMVADLIAGDDEVTHQQTGRPALTTTTAIRLLLDKAATVDEAVALLREYDMNSSIDAAHHLSIADSSGKSVVVEYVSGEMVVTETKVVTNHYLGDHAKRGIGSEQSHLRYDTLAAQEGATDAAGVRELLESVAQKNYPQDAGSYEKTVWSIVYLPEEQRAEFYFMENFSHAYQLTLDGKDGFIHG